MRIPRALTVSICLLGVLASRAVGAPDAKAATKEALAATEVKILLPLLRTAMKEDFRRQAWYLATRILLGDPKNQEADSTVHTWKPAELEEGRDPTKTWLAARDSTFRKLGDQYALFARESAAAGAKAADLVPYVERALAYGSLEPDALATLDAAGLTYLGTYGGVVRGVVEKVLGPHASALWFPPEYDDTALRYRCLWPDSKVVEFGKTRLVSRLSPDDSWHTISLLIAEEAYFVKTFGSKAKDSKDKDEDEHTDVVVAPDVPAYGLLGDAFITDPIQRSEFDGTSTWFRSRRRLLLIAPLRDNAWTGRDATILGQAARAMLRRHIGAGTNARLQGRGTWLLDGFAGVFEGFAVNPATPDVGDVDPARCWRLAAMRELVDRGGLIPWDQLFAMDAQHAFDAPKLDLTFPFGGEKREGKQLVIPTIQATAVVLAIWQSDGGKGAKKLATLSEEIFKRNGLQDIDKALGVAPGKTVDLTEKYIRASAPK